MMKLYKQVNGSRNGMHLGVHSCLLGFLGVGHRYVIYYPEHYAQACPFWTEKVNSKLIDTASCVWSIGDSKWMIGLAGVDRDTCRVETSLRNLVPCDVVAGPVIMPSRVWASISCSRGVNERPWERSDELAVSLLAGGVRVTKAIRYAAHDPDLAKSIVTDIEGPSQWSELRDRIRKAGG